MKPIKTDFRKRIAQIEAMMPTEDEIRAERVRLAEENRRAEEHEEARWSAIWPYLDDRYPEVAERARKALENQDLDEGIDPKKMSPEDRLAWAEFEDIYRATSDETLSAHKHLYVAKIFELDPADPNFDEKVEKRMAEVHRIRRERGEED
jgi:hypothetical protein